MNQKQKEFLDKIVEKKQALSTPKLGFSTSIFMLFGLPTLRLPNNPAFWEKENSFCSVSINRHPDFEIPYGCYARMNQIFIDTEVKTKATNVIDVGRSFSEYVEKLGYNDGYANKALIRQLVNYITTAIRIKPKRSDVEAWNFKGLQTFISNEYDINFDVKNPLQLMLGKGKIRLNAEYAQYIYEHSAPLDMIIINLFKRNPHGLDFYRYLAYRNNNLNETLAFEDKYLFEQLGCEISNVREARYRFNRLLKMIKVYWPVQAKFQDGYFILKPSEPVINKIAKSLHPLKITKELSTETC